MSRQPKRPRPSKSQLGRRRGSSAPDSWLLTGPIPCWPVHRICYSYFSFGFGLLWFYLLLHARAKGLMNLIWSFISSGSMASNASRLHICVHKGLRDSGQKPDSVAKVGNRRELAKLRFEPKG